MAKMKRAVGNGKEDDSSSGSKKRRKLSFSDEECTGLDTRAKCSDSPPLSKIYNSACRNNKPAELFRKDLISAMKLPDSEQLDPEEFWCVTDTWKQEWERGVQVPVNSRENVPLPKIKEIQRIWDIGHFKLPKKFVKLGEDEFFSPDIHTLSTVMEDAEKVCRYDMDDLDCYWLQTLNEEREDLGLPPIDEKSVELAMENFENQCFSKFQEAFKTEEGLGIEYDEDVICDVCRTPECEEGNEMVFCDVCNICVHQACYGITAIPDGSWVCRTCTSNVQPSCILCPNKGGAMKSTSGDQWAHVSCALWIPEVTIVDAEKMEPITKISQIPSSRWSLICTLCRERVGACIQCCVKQCKIAYHVTCAFEHGLEMKGIVDETKEDDGVKLKSYCLKHSNNNKEVLSASEGIVWKIKNVIKKESKQTKVSDLDKQNARLQKIRTMEAEFYKYVNTKETQKSHNIQADIVDFIFCYWKLKRMANFNKPLIPTKLDEAALLGKHEDSLYARMKMFVHLRQDLERVRNLCYMVSRREKLRRSFFKTKESIFLKVMDTLKSKLSKRNSNDVESVIQATIGTSVYDRIYCSKNYVAREQPLVPKELEDDKAKLGTAARLPNPYAKRYFNGIHTRSRRHTTTSQTPTDENAEKIDFKRSKSEERSSDSTEVTYKVSEKADSADTVEDPKISNKDVKTEPREPVPDIAPDSVEKVPKSKTTVDTKDVTDGSGGDDTVPSECGIRSNKNAECPDSVFEDIVKSETPKEEQLSDLKNSPCQSDKENMVSNSKVRGRKSRNQMDIKSVELSKAIENLSLKSDAETHVSDCFKVKNNNIETESKLDGNRYLMRSRNRSTSESQPDQTPLFSGKVSSGSKATFNHVHESLPSSDKRLSESADDDDDYKDEEHMSGTEKDKAPTIVKLRRKRRVKRRLLSKLKSSDGEEGHHQEKVPDFSDTESSDGNELDRENSGGTHSLSFSQDSEFKMTLRQGKILWSPRKLALRNGDKLLSHDLRHRSFSSLADESSIESEKPEIVDSDSQNSLSEAGSMSKVSSPHDRDVTSSPRLVLRLKKDPERQRWQAEEPTSLDSMLFKVVRNDWDSSAHKSDKDDTNEWQSVEDFDRNYSGHRYMMRKRPKQVTSYS